MTTLKTSATGKVMAMRMVAGYSLAPMSSASLWSEKLGCGKNLTFVPCLDGKIRISVELDVIKQAYHRNIAPILIYGRQNTITSGLAKWQTVQHGSPCKQDMEGSELCLGMRFGATERSLVFSVNFS